MTSINSIDCKVWPKEYLKILENEILLNLPRLFHFNLFVWQAYSLYFGKLKIEGDNCLVLGIVVVEVKKRHKIIEF